MPSIKLAAVALLTALAAPTGEGKITKQKYDFIRKMRESERVNGPIRMTKPNLAEFLRKSEQVGSLKGNNKSGSGSAAPKVSKDELERRLNYYNDYHKFATSQGGQGERANQQYNNYNANNANVQNHANKWWWFWNNEGKNDTLWNTQDMYTNNGENATYNIEGFQDLAIKYAGCTSATSFAPDDDEDENGNAFKSNALIQYRLCPAESCQEDSWDGCNSEYGEYMMSLEDFLDTQKDLLEEEFHLVCSYCNACYSFNDKYCENDHCCSHSGDCGGYDQICYGEGDDDDVPDYEDLFDCMEVELGNNNNGNRQLYNNHNYKYLQGSNYYGDDGVSSVYVGVHCNGMRIEVGIFADDTCTTLIATEEQVDIEALTGVDFKTEDLESFYVPQGCLECGGDDYNWKKQWWYVEGDKDEENEYDYVNAVCYNMYESSAKCNTNLNEDIQELLEESDTEYANEASTCNFIRQAVMGNVDENGFVLTDSSSKKTVWNTKSYAPNTNEVPVYGSSNSMTGGQATALTFSVLGTVGMAGAVYYLRQQLEAQGAEGLMPQEDKQID